MKKPSINISRIDCLRAFAPATTAVLLVSALAFASVAQAVPMLQNITTGQTIFNADFESTFVPTSGTLNVPTNISPLVGTWSPGARVNDDGRLFVGVTNQDRSGVVAQDGDNFFMLATTAGPTGNTGQAWTGLGLTANSGSGDTIEANIAFNLTSDSNRALFYLWGGPSQNVLLGAFGLEGNLTGGFTDYSVTSHNGTAFQQTSLSFLPDVWNTLTISHVNGANKDYEISINGGPSITADGLADAATHSTNFVNAIYLNQTTDTVKGTVVYFDASAIPEATTMGLLGVGLMLMMMIRRYARR